MSEESGKPQLDAFFHLDRNEVEFVFAFLDPKKPEHAGFLDRSFTLHFEGDAYTCSFREPTARLYHLARYFNRSSTYGEVIAARQLLPFRDVQRLETLPPKVAEFFKAHVPRSFFITSTKPVQEIDWENTSRHLNFLMSYYDRSTPQIAIRPKTPASKETAVSRLRFVEGSFPSELVFRSSDDVLLRLIEVARQSTPRFAFIYCYQILEYAGFYYIDSKTKNELLRLLRSPSFLSNADEHVPQLFSLLTDTAQNEDGRIQKVIEDLCDPKTLWKEIEQNRKFFASDVTFEGGFSLPKLISGDMTSESWCTCWLSKTFQHLTKIRNCLVHAREKRESKVILPTEKNNEVISNYLPIIMRLAEQIVFNSPRVN